MKKKFQVRF